MKAKFIYESLFIKKQGKDILHDFEYEYFGRLVHGKSIGSGWLYVKDMKWHIKKMIKLE